MHLRVHPEPALSPWCRQGLAGSSQLHVSDTSLSAQELARYQRRTTDRDLHDLVWQCAEQYRYALQLVHPCEEFPDWYARREQADVSDLYWPWDDLCAAYRFHLFDAQLDFFRDQQVREIDRWHAFKRDRVFGPMLRSPAITRCILERCGFLKDLTGLERTSLETVFEEIKLNMPEWRGNS